MPQSAVYLSDMCGFPRAGEPILISPSGSILVGVDEAEHRRVQPNRDVVHYFRDDKSGGTTLGMDTWSPATDGFSGFSALADAVVVGHFHGTSPRFNIGSSLFVANTLYVYSTHSGGVYFGSAHASASVFFFSGGSATTNERMRILSTGHVGISASATPFTPTAYLHIAAGTTAAGTAPLKFTSGSLLSAAAAGAVEFLTDKIYFTITTSAARKEITLNDAALTAGRVPFTTTNGRLGDDATLQWDNSTKQLNNSFGGPVGDIGVAKNNNGQTSIVCSNYNNSTAGSAGVFAGSGGGTLNYTGHIKYGNGFTTAGLIVPNAAFVYNESALLVVGTTTAHSVIVVTNGTATTNARITVDSAGNVVIGNAALATNATDGFLYLPSSAGAPSGTPTTKTGMVPVQIDTTNSTFEAYIGGAWVGVTLA